MKPKNARISTLSIIACALATGSLAAADLTWDANNTGALQTDGAGTWLAANQWWDGSSNVSWNSATPDNAIIGNGGAGGAITVGSLTAGSIGLNNFTGTYTLQGTASTLTQNGGITIGASAGHVTLRGTAATTGLLTIAGTGGITMNGSGILNLRENLTLSYTGATVISNGVVIINGGSKPAGNFSLNGGILTDYFQQTGVFTSGLGTGNNQIQITGNSGFGAGNGTSTWRIGVSGSTLVWGASGEGSATGFFNPAEFTLRATQGDNNGPTIFGTPSIDNRLDLNSGTRTVKVNLGGGNIGGSRATIVNGIQDTGAAGNLIKTGGGMLVIGSATSTWGGNTTVNAGILDLGTTNVANIGGGSGRDISVAAGAGLRFSALSNTILSRVVETTDMIAIMTAASANNLDFSGASGGANLPNAFLGNFASNGAKAEMTGTITPGSNGYKLGALGSSGNLGIRSVLSGANSLTVGQTGATARVTLALANTFTGETVINTGTRLALGNNLSLQNSPLNVGSAGGTIGFNEGTAATTIGDNTVVTSPTFGGLIGSRNLSSVFTNAASNNENNIDANLVTGFTLNVALGSEFTYSGAIGGFGTGTTNIAGGGINGNSTLTKTGLGTQTLAGTSTYTGATTVSAGTLYVTGSLNASAVTVQADGTIGSAGGIGVRTLGNGLTIEAGGNLDLMGATIAANSMNILSITGGSLTLGALSFQDITGWDWSNAAEGTYELIDGSFTVDFGSTTFTSPSTAYDFGNGRQGYFTSGSLNAVIIAAVPEPRAALLGAIGLIALLRRRR